MINRLSISDTPDILRTHLEGAKTLWIGALSFEERCLGSMRELHHAKLSIDSCVVLNYSTKVYPAALSDELRAKHLMSLHELGGSVRRFDISSHSFRALQELVKRQVTEADIDLVIFDISCFSKIHTMALAFELSQLKKTVSWSVAYTVPENYGGLAVPTQPKGWRDVIIAPLAETAQLFNETFSRGLILPGHDADRLIVALAELEPSGGQIVIVDTPHRPDLRKLSKHKNHNIIRQLTRMRSRLWTNTVISLNDLSSLDQCIEIEIQEARSHKAPLILFPFGPKSLIFYAALVLCNEYPSASWFVYPIPIAYDVSYTEGIERVSWISKLEQPINRKHEKAIFQGKNTLPLFSEPN